MELSLDDEIIILSEESTHKIASEPTVETNLELSDCDKIVIILSEGKRFETTRKIAFESEFMKSVIENGETNEVTINLDYPSWMIESMLEFVKHHIDSQLPTIDRPLPEKFENAVPEWDLEFAKRFDVEQSIDFIHFVTFVNIQQLLDLLCARIGYFVRDGVLIEQEFFKEAIEWTKKEIEKEETELRERMAVTEKARLELLAKKKK